MSNEINEKAVENKNKGKGAPWGFLAFLLTLVTLVLVGNLLFFNNDQKVESVVLVETVGDAVVLRYADPNEQYTLQGISDSVFIPSESAHIFYDGRYRVSDSGETYDIVNSTGKRIGSVKLQLRSEESENTLNIDISQSVQSHYKISSEYSSVCIFSSNPDVTECVMSIEIEERNHALDISIDNVKIQAPDFSPAIYSVTDADVNLKINGEVWLVGGHNPLLTSQMSDAERVLSTMNTAANAYYVCMLSAIGTTGSLLYGVDYYADMFEGVTSLQLNVMENTWGQIEGLFLGQNGASGLDGLPAIQLAGNLNIIGDSLDSLFVKGGNGGNGQDGTNGFMSESDGGDAGDGGDGVICNHMVMSQFFINFSGGESGFAGAGGSSIMGEQGNWGESGSQGSEKVLFGLEFSYALD